MSSAKRIRSLKTESDALLKRLRMSSKLPQEPVTASSSMTVPNEVLKELDKYVFLSLKKGGGLWNMMKSILSYDLKI